jgi:hypothetical protein
VQVSGEFSIGSHGEQMLSSSLHKRVHPYPVSEPGIYLSQALIEMINRSIITIISHDFHVFARNRKRKMGRKERGRVEREDG